MTIKRQVFLSMVNAPLCKFHLSITILYTRQFNDECSIVASFYCVYDYCLLLKYKHFVHVLSKNSVLSHV